MSDSQALIVATDARPTISHPHQIDSDQHLIHLWLHSEGRRSERTRIEYQRDIQAFQESSGLLLRELSLQSLLDYQELLSHLSPSTQARRLASLKSLLSFGYKLGYLQFDVGQVVSAPIIENKLSERILSEEQLFRILALETNPRNLLLLKIFYVSAGRVTETVSLRWRNLQPRESGGQITFFGKGGKTRAVMIPQNLWDDLMRLKHPAILQNANHEPSDHNPGNDSRQPDSQIDKESLHSIPSSIFDQPVFQSQKKSQLSVSQAWRIVRAAALRAAIGRNVSPHWFRHAHISHALDNGAPIHLVSETAGHSNVSTTSRYTHARPGESSSKYLKIK